jgi:hypothetical protein
MTSPRRRSSGCSSLTVYVGKDCDRAAIEKLKEWIGGFVAARDGLAAEEYAGAARSDYFETRTERSLAGSQGTFRLLDARLLDELFACLLESYGSIRAARAGPPSPAVIRRGRHARV